MRFVASGQAKINRAVQKLLQKISLLINMNICSFIFQHIYFRKKQGLYAYILIRNISYFYANVY